MNRMRITFTAATAVILAIIAVVATSGGAAKPARPTAPPASAISVKQTSLGQTLVDANGRSLYLFLGDTRNMSTLSAAGQAVWPPFTASTKPAAQGGTVAARIGTIKGAAGASQITYGGHPLYYYVGDRTPGQTRGQGLNQFGARWYVLAPNGTAITLAPRSTAPAAPAAPSSSGSSYAY
jgi:predicted lipoprotein with Yx(FWY)xxD motif